MVNIQSIPITVGFNDEIRSTTVPVSQIGTNSPFEQLLSFVSDSFVLAATPFVLHYRDQDNDVITLGSQVELVDALAQSQQSPLAFQVVLRESTAATTTTTAATDDGMAVVADGMSKKQRKCEKKQLKKMHKKQHKMHKKMHKHYHQGGDHHHHHHHHHHPSAFEGEHNRHNHQQPHQRDINVEQVAPSVEMEAQQHQHQHPHPHHHHHHHHHRRHHCHSDETIVGEVEAAGEDVSSYVEQGGQRGHHQRFGGRGHHLPGRGHRAHGFHPHPHHHHHHDHHDEFDGEAATAEEAVRGRRHHFGGRAHHYHHHRHEVSVGEF